MVVNSLVVAERAHANPGHSSVPDCCRAAEAGPFRKVHLTVPEVSSRARRSCKDGESAESNTSEGESDSGEAALCGEELLLTKKVLVGLVNDLIGGIVNIVCVLKISEAPWVNVSRRL